MVHGVNINDYSYYPNDEICKDERVDERRIHRNRDHLLNLMLIKRNTTDTTKPSRNTAMVIDTESCGTKTATIIDPTITFETSAKYLERILVCSPESFIVSINFSINQHTIRRKPFTFLFY